MSPTDVICISCGYKGPYEGNYELDSKQNKEKCPQCQVLGMLCRDTPMTEEWANLLGLEAKVEQK